MAFGGGFGGFGSNQNNTSGFGASAFGSSATNAGNTNNTFGQPAASSNLFGQSTGTAFGFGSNAATATPSTFGASTAPTSSPFGAVNKPTFGATPASGGGGIFGGGSSTFGNNGFGSSNTGGSNTFGGAKPTTTGNTMFGSGTFGNTSTQPTNNGTGSTPFSAFIEKDNAANTNSHYQSITFMQPYQAFSFEELRLADYSAGRKVGNANGQAGAFGQASGFGSGFNSGQAASTSTFGAPQATNTGGGIFGAQASTPATGTFGSGFGQQNNSTSTGLFGQQNKPASGGIFGNAPASTANATSTPFGASTSNTFGTFGQQNNNSNSTGLFGQQSKPTGMFGNSSAPTSTSTFGSTPAASSTPFGGSSTGAFGQAANTNTTGGTGLFGQNTTNNTASPFGTQAPAANTGNNLFGGGGNAFGQNNQNQQQNQTGTTNNLFGGGFGQNNQQKPSPFGGAASGTSSNLFGGAQTQQSNTSGGLFNQASNNNQAQTNSLFGAKPATGNLFGSSQPQQNTGTGLFGGGQAQQSTPSLFGNQSNQQKPATGLFGNTGAQPAASNSLFGGNQNQQQNTGNSLFGGSTQQSGQSNGSFGQSNQQQSSFAATLLTNPYGNDQLFSNLGSPAPAVGPLATPLSGAQKPAKRPAALPQFKINPSASLRLITPQKRSNGYGFSYATYGTPGSAQSFTSNGLGSSLLQSGGLSRSLGKSFSTSNLNKSVGSGDSVLAPGAFTPNNRSYTGGSIRRLKIDRNLRTDLFGDNTPVEPPTKRVSFDEGDKGKTSTNGYVETPASSALVRTETDEAEPSSEDLGYSRAERHTTDGASVNGTSSTNQVRGNELAMVPEDGPAPASSTKPVSAKDVPRSQADPQPGDYWMSPSMEDLRNMSRQQLKRVTGFTVGRRGVGKVEFDPVDLTQVPLDEIIDDIVKLNVRQVTVYTTGVNTPPMGQGLNVPSTITLENSWPRAQAGRLPVHERKGQRYEKHIERLKRVQDTEFISYDPETGIWVFRVPHFTTYGLDDDDESDDEAEYGSDMMSTGQDLTPKGNNTAVQEMSQASSEEGSVISDEDDESNPDDTFDFKKGPSKILPGSFGAQPIHNDDEMADDNDAQDQEEDSSYLEHQDPHSHEDQFRSSGSSNAPPVEAVDEQMEEEMDYEEMDGQDMAGSFPEPAAQAPYNDYGISFSGSLMPKSILKASTMLNGTPKKDLALAGDWAEQLQRTASPKKQDRQALRERQSVMGAAPVDTAPPLAASIAGKAFSTTMDIMNSLWAPSASVAGHGLQTSTVGGKGFEWPYQKQSRTEDAFADMNENERGFHTSFKPRWATDGTLVYSTTSAAPPLFGNMIGTKKPIVSEHKDVRFAKFKSPQDTLTTSLQLQLQQSAITSAETSFAAMAESVAHPDTPEAQHERSVWRLASILFDPVEIGCPDLVKNISSSEVVTLESRIRRDALSNFWAQLVHAEAAQHAKDAGTAEEKAIAFLSGNSIEDACSALLEGRDFRLATIVAQLPGNSKSKEMMAKQIENWRSQNMISEMTEAVRALYELVAGNTCISEGKSGPAEDKASAFGISSRFGLDWRRSFGLRLWFSGANDSLADAVQLYIDDLAADKETIRPVPYFTEQSLAPSWHDTDAQGNEDTLLGLLKLYSRQPSSNISDVRSLVTNLLSPASVSGSPLNARLSWQLATLLQKKGLLTAAELSDAALDQLSLTLSGQLEAANELVFATNVLLHLTNESAREKHIRDLLYRRAAALYDASNPDALPTVLTQDFGLPEQWLWHARALYARSMLEDHNAEVSYLLRAGDSAQAHAVLCRTVGPAAIIQREYDSLRQLLDLFQNTLSTETLESWRTGGQVYSDYTHLLDLVRRDDDASRATKKELLDRLTVSLPGVLEGRTGKVDLEERVAIGEMAGLVKAEVEKMGREDKGVDRSLVNRLPVAGAKYATQGVDLSRAYYRAIVA
ncbi:uncharacterized protein M437DRAFT_48873 [Aureobasidium melanogenum CBS 110374]|uniref:Peptidase S59 domain-containing protein n=1 Tax=Aureobasidium melanogenum (strain CBS 110374) TaxID=1043003 RepID=A0A074VYA5_AURM1|nr:uncharacterized protein M437DRAFT_48873 [Aureobasidium melanogenum CBS 110374]KEQ62662.1 hypothetical protein M437DRAFT_48873 [Aureobasidium melanogenum CBS 110374]